MYAIRLLAFLFGALILHLTALAGPAVYKCTTNGSVTYQNSPCPSAQPRVQPTVEQLNSERQKKLSQTAETRTTGTTLIPESPAKLRSSPSGAPAQRFTCDGRTHCSHMTSCAEAKYFLANCPNVKMDGDHDGIPCEQQWCH
jgi:hypothetical protein